MIVRSEAPHEHESPQLEAGGFRVKQQGAA